MKLPISLLLLSTFALARPQDDVVFRSNVSLVRVDVEAVDAAGAVVAGLVKEDFRVSDEGAVQTLSSSSFQKEPLDLILLFDTSGGMKGKVHQILRAVELGFHELQPGDRACVMAFGAKTQELEPFTANMDTVNNAFVLKVLTLPFNGSTDQTAAADSAAVRFRREPSTNRRRAVLLITDKAGVRGAADDNAVRDLWASDAVLGKLVLEKPGANKVVSLGQNAIADRTGGATIIAGDPGPAFQESLRRLRRRYTLYYPMPAGAPGSQRRIEVRLTAEAEKRFPGVTLRAREGYVVPGN